MKIRWRWVCVWVLVLGSFPVNWWMMDRGVGFYVNDPEYVWWDGWERREARGPSVGWRTASLILSPVSVPFNAVAEVAKWTTDERPPPRRPDSWPCPLPGPAPDHVPTGQGPMLQRC